MSPLNIEYSDILKKFSKAKIRFVVLGGFAAIAHGVVRVTMDLDLSVSLNKEDLEKAWDILSKLGFIIRQPIRQEEFTNPVKLMELIKDKDAKAISFIHSKLPYLVVDLLFDKPFQIGDNDVVWVELFGCQCPVVGIKKLIELKEAANRPKDLEDIRELKKIKKED